MQPSISALVMYVSIENWEHDWWKTIIKMLLGAIILTLFWNITSYFSIAFEVNKVQKQVQKLLYEDLLYQLEQSKEDSQIKPFDELEKAF